MVFHLVFSAFTFEGVDMSMAEKIINYNIERYPNGTRHSCYQTLDMHVHCRVLSLLGVFFLFGQGRLKLCRSQPAEALQYYQRAMEVQDQYRNLYHISYWEMAIANLALWDVQASLGYWRKLQEEATVRVSLYAVFCQPLNDF